MELAISGRRIGGRLHLPLIQLVKPPPLAALLRLRWVAVGRNLEACHMLTLPLMKKLKLKLMQRQPLLLVEFGISTQHSVRRLPHQIILKSQPWQWLKLYQIHCLLQNPLTTWRRSIRCVIHILGALPFTFFTPGRFSHDEGIYWGKG